MVTDGVPAQAILLHFYDPISGLRRIDNLASRDGISFDGVSFFEVYLFDNELATTLELRRIPPQDVTLNIEPDDLSGNLESPIGDMKPLAFRRRSLG